MHPSDTGCTLLVCSCDRYSDLWEPYFSLLRLRWPDCPFPVALITENKRPSIPGVRPLALGTGLDWSTLLLRALDAVETSYVLLTLEDFFLRRKVDTGRLVSLLDDVRRDSLRMLRLTPRPGPTTRLDNREYGSIGFGVRHKVSAQAAFWRVDTLRQLLLPGETAWEFELNGTSRSAALDGFASVWREALPYRHHVIERGKWFPWSYWRFRRMNIGVDPLARSVMSPLETTRWVAMKVLSPLARHVPRRVRRAMLRVRT